MNEAGDLQGLESACFPLGFHGTVSICDCVCRPPWKQWTPNRVLKTMCLSPVAAGVQEAGAEATRHCQPDLPRGRTFWVFTVQSPRDGPNEVWTQSHPSQLPSQPWRHTRDGLWRSSRHWYFRFDKDVKKSQPVGQTQP